MLSANQVDVSTTGEQISAQLVTLTQKYLGNNEYVLSGTSNGYIGAQINAMAPWGNLTNKYYPTVATLPQSGNNLVTKDQLGYFTPNNTGASVYLTKGITPYININSITPGTVYKYADPTKFNKGRGLTENDQDSIITHIEDKNWLKAANTGTAFDGQVINTDNYQKFIPYQSDYETTKRDSNGVVTIKDDYEFWTGNQKNIWLSTNKFTEQDWLQYHDINARINSLLITPLSTELYSWQTDVFGNNYALYKNVPPAGRTIYNMQSAFGQLFVKTVDGTILPAVSALSAVYSKYINNLDVYPQLISNNIKNFEVFYDTLIIELSGYTIYEKIKFDYTSCSINSHGVDFLPLDYHTKISSKLLSSTSLTGVTVSDKSDVYYGGHWYDEHNKKITACLLLSSYLVTTSAASSLIVPVLYQYDINNPGNRVRIYPTNNTDYSLYLYTGSTMLTYIEPPVITYNNEAVTYSICFIGYIGQNFNIICYTTRENLGGKVITNEVIVPITTETNTNILAV